MSDRDQPVAANLLDRPFTAAAPHQRWVGDTTAFVIGESGQLYLAAILDLCSRLVVGWAVSAVNDRHLPVKALGMAWKRRCPDAGGGITPTRAARTPVKTISAGSMRTVRHHCSMSRFIKGSTPIIFFNAKKKRPRRTINSAQPSTESTMRWLPLSSEIIDGGKGVRSGPVSTGCPNRLFAVACRLQGFRW